MRACVAWVCSASPSLSRPWLAQPLFWHSMRTCFISQFVTSTLLAVLVAVPAPAQNPEPPVPAPLQAPALTADAVQEAFVRVAERLKPSVVTLHVQRAGRSATTAGGTPIAPAPSPFSPREPDGERSSLGTGMVIDAEGTILTNYHVVKDASLIRVLFNADTERPERVLARMAGFDDVSDLAVLQLVNRQTLRAPIVPVEFADSDKLRVGEWAIAIGAPFDQAQSVTVGIVSASGRHLDQDNRLSLQNYLQTDASINPGNSGGPLVNLDGKVIGVNTAILSPSRYNVGIGFAVPSNTASEYWPLLKRGESIARGFLGVQYTAIDDDVARTLNIEGGMQIGALAKRGESFLGPAKDAGLQEGDIITAVNGQSVTTTQQFRKLVVKLKPSTRVSLTVLRPDEPSSKPQTVSVVLGDWAAQSAQTPAQSSVAPRAEDYSSLGFRLRNATELSAAESAEVNFQREGDGVVVILDVLPGSAADFARIQKGLRIERVRTQEQTWQPIKRASDFAAIEKSLPPATPLLMILRDRSGALYYKSVMK